jgi:hypothetical protein
MKVNRLQPSASTPARSARTLAVAPFEGFDRQSCLAVQQEIIDDQLADLTEGELKVMLMVTRATNGGQREAVPLSVRVLCEGGAPDVLPARGSGLSPRTVQGACSALEAAGFLRVHRRVAPDGSGLPSLFTLPLIVPGLREPGEATSAKFPGYSAGRRVRLPLLLFDRLLAELSGAELKVLLYILRHTFCVGVADEIMPMARLVENTGLSLRHTRLAVAALTTRGAIVVQHRQDPDHGKLASRFGVKVIGEAAPFTSLPSPAAAARAARAEEPAEPRPVWLVPAINKEPVAAPLPEPENRVAAGTAQGVTEPTAPLQVVPVAAELAPIEQPPPAPVARAALPPASPTPILVAGSSPRSTLPPGSSTPIVVAGQSPRSTLPPASPTPMVAAGSSPRSTLPPGSSTPIVVAGQSPRSSTPPPVRSISATMTRDNSPVWAAVKQLLSERLPYQVFVERIAPTSSIGDQGPELFVAVQNEHHRWWLESKLARQIHQALVDAGYGGTSLRYLNFVGTPPSDGEERS